MFGLSNYGQRCAAPLTGVGWDVGLYGLAATPAAAARQAAAAQKKQAALAKRTAATAARKAKRAMRVAGKTVNTSNPAAATAMHNFVAGAQKEMSATIAAANSASKQIAVAKAAKTPQARAQARAAATAAVKSVTARASALGKKLVDGGAKPTATPAAAPTTPAARAAANRAAAAARRAGVRGLGVCDPTTGYDSDTGMPCDSSGYVDPTYGGGYVDPSTYGGYYGQQVPAAPAIQTGFDASSLTTGLVPGFGTSMFPQTTAPRGCANGSSAPRCLIYQMAQDEQQQFYFVFSILQQMYAQLLQIVQQLMQQLQYSQQYGQQQPGYPYTGYGPTTPYGQSPYGQDPYAMYGQASPYGSPYGTPGVPYYPGGDTGVIPDGYDSGGGTFDSGGIPSDMTQIFPGPSGGAFPQSPSPSQPTIISSDSLPDGAGPSTGSEFGDESAPVPAFQAVAPLIPQVASPGSQPVSAGPGQPNIVVQLQMPGQSPYADAMLPQGDENQLVPQPQVEPAGGGQDEWAQEF